MFIVMRCCVCLEAAGGEYEGGDLAATNNSAQTSREYGLVTENAGDVSNAYEVGDMQQVGVSNADYGPFPEHAVSEGVYEVGEFDVNQ